MQSSLVYTMPIPKSHPEDQKCSYYHNGRHLHNLKISRTHEGVADGFQEEAEKRVVLGL